MTPVDAYIRGAQLVPVVWTGDTFEPDEQYGGIVLCWALDKPSASLACRAASRLVRLLVDVVTEEQARTIMAHIGKKMPGVLRPDAAVRAAASAAIAEIEADFDRRRKAGELRSVDRNYRNSRIRGVRLPNYEAFIRHLRFSAYAQHGLIHREKLFKTG